MRISTGLPVCVDLIGPFELLQSLAESAVLEKCGAALAHRPADNVLLPVEQGRSDFGWLETVRKMAPNLCGNEFVVVGVHFCTSEIDHPPPPPGSFVTR